MRNSNWLKILALLVSCLTASAATYCWTEEQAATLSSGLGQANVSPGIKKKLGWQKTTDVATLEQIDKCTPIAERLMTEPEKLSFANSAIGIAEGNTLSQMVAEHMTNRWYARRDVFDDVTIDGQRSCRSVDQIRWEQDLPPIASGKKFFPLAPGDQVTAAADWADAVDPLVAQSAGQFQYGNAGVTAVGRIWIPTVLANPSAAFTPDGEHVFDGAPDLIPFNSPLGSQMLTYTFAEPVVQFSEWIVAVGQFTESGPGYSYTSSNMRLIPAGGVQSRTVPICGGAPPPPTGGGTNGSGFAGTNSAVLTNAILSDLTGTNAFFSKIKNSFSNVLGGVLPTIPDSNPELAWKIPTGSLGVPDVADVEIAMTDEQMLKARKFIRGLFQFLLALVTVIYAWGIVFGGKEK